MGSFFVQARRLDLPPGFRMTWKTRALPPLKVPMVRFTCNICSAYNEVEHFASEPATAPAGPTCACAR